MVYQLQELLVLYAEAIACLKAIEFAAEVAMGQIIIETDASLLKWPLQSCEFGSARHGVSSQGSKISAAHQRLAL
jgi:hypothetical protein